MRLILSGMVPVNRLELKNKDSMLFNDWSDCGRGPEKSFSYKCNDFKLTKLDRSGTVPVNVFDATLSVPKR